MLVLKNHILWTGGSDALVSEWGEVLWAFFQNAFLVLPDVAFFAVGVAPSESESESLSAGVSDAFSVLESVSLLASLQHAGLLWGEHESLSFAGDSDTGLSLSLEAGSALDLVALLVFLVHAVSAWAALSDALSSDEVEVLGTEGSDALAVLGFESSWALHDAGRFLEGESFLTRLQLALVSVHAESSWALSQGTFSVDEFVAL